MSNSTPSNRAVGLVSIGNPITLIASFDKFKTLCPGYNIYVCLNISREHISDENFQKLTNNTYKIIADYEKYFAKIVVIENTSNVWLAHGQCIDLLFHTIQEPEMVIYEEDAYIFAQSMFDEMFNRLQTEDLVCVVAPRNPNNFAQLFGKLSIFVGSINMPGKESVFFIRKSILSKYDWIGFDYVDWNRDIVYTRPEGTKLRFQEPIGFDTFEFFSFNCWMNPSIKFSTYDEQNYDYWVPEGRGEIDSFYRNMSGELKYMHYFNGSLFSHIDYHHDENKQTYNEAMQNAPHFGQYLYHMSTHTIHFGMLRAVKSKYIALLGREEYEKHRKSLKNAMRACFSYFGYFYMRHKYNYGRFIKFTGKFTKRYHMVTE